MNTVNIITVQHKNVLNKILSDGVYYADTEKYIAEKRSNLLKPYQYLINEYGYEHFPIFGCEIGYNCEFYGADCGKDSMLIQLNVPADKVKIQNYYDWTDLIFFMENPQEWQGKMGKDIVPRFNTYPLEQFFKDTLHPAQACRVHQATIECIEKAWIEYAMPVTEKFCKLHNGSGGNNVLNKLPFYK